MLTENDNYSMKTSRLCLKMVSLKKWMVCLIRCPDVQSVVRPGLEFLTRSWPLDLSGTYHPLEYSHRSDSENGLRPQIDLIAFVIVVTFTTYHNFVLSISLSLRFRKCCGPPYQFSQQPNDYKLDHPIDANHFQSCKMIQTNNHPN